ncbi:MAG TPA: copper amine oxidase [Thermoanaerobacterales bacterium]|jgi:spore germination protein|nr:copper amine oxidase [Thermoanaerobacterales bacterium]
MNNSRIWKKLIIGVFSALFIIMTLIPAKPCEAATYVKVLLNGENIDFDVPPIIENDRTLAPFRKIGEALGAQIEWDQDTKTVTANKEDKRVVLRIGDYTAYINQTPIKLDTPPIIKDNRTLVPVRFFSEAFGAAVMWDNAVRTVLINTDGKPSKYIMGYYYSQSYEDFLKNFNKMSSTAVKWYTLDMNGDLTDRDNSRYINVPEGYENVVKLSKENGIEIHMLVFESDSARLEKVLATPESRTRLVNQMITVVEREGYDGINVDFEYLKVADKDRFNEFVKSLYGELKVRGKSLNLSLPVKTEQTDWWPAYDYLTLGQYCDFAVLMAYDKNPGTPGPQSGIDWVEEVVDYAIARIPAEKVVLGIGYYGYDWAAGKRSSVIAENNGATYLVFADELSKKYGLNLNLDQKSGLLFGTYTDENGASHEIWMESNYSVDAKAKLAVRKGLKGVALWRLGFSNSSFWDTLMDNFKPVKYQ